jgi:NAD(P)-dependent dehydrogenase (short-subunit alcohol dehydrogenase family)
MLVHTLFWNVQPTMAPTPHRIAQTTSEVKKQYKKNGARIPERQLKQLERAHELDQRAARCRDADERRKAAKKKRDEREEKEQRARRQIGVGLATQLIGYSHTQAQLKNGMEAFLGVKQRKDNEQRRKNLELTKKLETIAQDLEKEPWDDDEADDLALDLPELKQEKLTDSYRSYRGSIVNVASMYGVVAPPLNVPATAYATSKHAVIGLTKSDALAFAHRGIRINAISPGYVMTPLVQETMGKGDMMETERKKVPVHRYSEMEEIGDCIAFLHSNAASYMVGATLVADGGYTIS